MPIIKTMKTIVIVMMLKLGNTNTDTNEDTDDDTYRDGEDSNDDNDKYYHIDST